MWMMDSLKTLVDGAATRVTLFDPAAGGKSTAVVSTLVTSILGEFDVKLRHGCSAEYLHGIISSDDLESCSEMLARVFGLPRKPFGCRPMLDEPMQRMVDSHDGIHADQCLYLRRYNDGRVAFAALWPWSNGVLVTLRLGVYDESVTPEL